MRPRKATLPAGLALGWPRPRKVATGEEPGTTSPASAILSRLPAARLMYRASTLRASGGATRAWKAMSPASLTSGMAVPLEPLLPPGAPCQATFARARGARGFHHAPAEHVIDEPR